MKKILLSIATIALVTAVSVKATGAFFTDKDVSNGNAFTAGNFEIQVNGNTNEETDPDHFNIDLGTISGMVPGDTTSEATITVKNNSSTNAAVFSKFTLTDSTGLANALNFYLYRVEYLDDHGNPVGRWATHDPYYGTNVNEDFWIKDGVVHPNFLLAGGNGNLNGWVTGSGPLDIMGTDWDMEGLKPGYSYVLHFKMQMDPTASNSYQGKTVNLGYEVDSTQINTAAIVGLGLGGDLNNTSYVDTNVTPYLNHLGLP